MDLGRKRRNTRHCLQETKKRDYISSLPVEVLARILSLLPTKYAVATTILSSKWKNLYLLSNNLDFDDSLSINPKGNLGTQKRNSSFPKFVDQVLVRHKESQVLKFGLKCSKHVKYSLLTAWIDAALVLHKVIELELSIDMGLPFVLQLSNLTCQNLKVLKLDCSFVLRVPKSMTFPCLKVLFCNEVTFPRDGSILSPSNDEFCDINEILLGCPLLEELVIIGCDWNGCDLSFSNPLLKKLTLDVGLSGVLDQLNGCSIYFNLPSLVYLKYSESLPERYVIKNMSSVVNAHLEVCFNDDEFDDPQDLCDTMLDLIHGVSNSKFLYLSGQCLEALTSGEFDLLDFQNLTRLKLGQGYDVSWNDVLLDFLNSSPCLETLTLVQARGNADGELDEDFLLGDHRVPSCVSLCLKVLILENFTGLKGEIDMVVYFLEKANILEQMVIHWRHRKTTRETEVLNLPKASKTCSISFK